MDDIKQSYLNLDQIVLALILSKLSTTKSLTFRVFLAKLSLSEDFFKFSFSALNFLTRSCKCLSKSALLDFSADRVAGLTLGDWGTPFDDVVIVLREISRVVLYRVLDV